MFQSGEKHFKGIDVLFSLNHLQNIQTNTSMVPTVDFETTYLDVIGQSSKRPTAKILDVDVNASTVIVCDGRNFVTKIDVEKYFEYFPTSLKAKGGLTDARGVGRNIEREKSRNMELEYILCGDAVWRSEVLAIASELDADSGWSF